MDVFDDAEKKSIGFVYQDYVALKYLLELKPDESIGIEVFDDIHLEGISNQKTLIQVKHAIKNNTYLNNKSIDLWKTLYKWSESIKVINDKEMSFIFYTNRPATQEDGIVRLLASDTKDIKKIQNEIKKVAEAHDNKNNKLYKYLATISLLTEVEAERLFNSIRFVYSDKEIIEEIKIFLRTLAIPENKINDVFDQIYGAFSRYKYEIVKDNKKVKITYDDFREKIGVNRIVQISRSCINSFDQYYKFESVYPANLDNKISYKQLQDIQLDSKAIEFLNDMAKTEAFLQSLMNDGELTENEFELIYSKVFSEWKIRHNLDYMTESYDTISESHISTAVSLYKGLIKECSIDIENNRLPKEMVIGTLLSLSDKPKIGWLQHWESLYK